MKRRISLFLAVVLVLSVFLSTAAQAANVADFTDLKGHWALVDIEQVVNAGLMNGNPDKSFAPNRVITRGEFVTVLGRFAGINTEVWKMNYPTKSGSLFTDVPKDKYYSPYINWAARSGITRGVGASQFKPDAPIAREQIATMLKRFADTYGKKFDVVSGVAHFTDDTSISAFAKDSVDALRTTGIIHGIPNGNGSGTYRFDPQAAATRAQTAAIFNRTAFVLKDDPEWVEDYPTLVSLSERTATVAKGKTVTLKAQVFPATATNASITWVSSDPKVAVVDGNGKVTGVGNGTCTIYAYSVNGCKESCVVSCASKSPRPEDEVDYDALFSFDFDAAETAEDAFIESAAEPIPEFFEQDLSLASEYDSYYQKCERLFGGSVEEPRTYYATEEEARQDIVSIEVPAWDMDEFGNKYTRWFTIEVHKDLAATVDQIFREIYDCPAQYPIHAAGGFRFVSWSEHNFGAAIDLNPEENYYCSPDGEAIVGNYFSPETDEYSIPVGGEIDRIFAKYGFTRGIYWQSGYRDFMHYSFFGT